MNLFAVESGNDPIVQLTFAQNSTIFELVSLIIEYNVAIVSIIVVKKVICADKICSDATVVVKVHWSIRVENEIVAGIM